MDRSLHGTPETLLIPLWGRANAHRYGLPADPIAETLVRRAAPEGIRLPVAPKIQIFMALRSLLLDRCTADFLREHPNAPVLSLGSGLDGRCLRVTGYGCWTDVDLPEVIALRQELMGDLLPEHCTMVGSSVTESHWLDRLPREEGPVLILMEGLLMYLHPQEVAALLQRLVAHFPRCHLAFDAYSTLTVRGSRFQPSLRKTGAQIFWGMDTPEELEQLCPGLRFRQKIFLTDAPELALLPRWYRLMFALAGKSRTAREAHRIFVWEAP